MSEKSLVMRTEHSHDNVALKPQLVRKGFPSAIGSKAQTVLMSSDHSCESLRAIPNRLRKCPLLITNSLEGKLSIWSCPAMRPSNDDLILATLARYVTKNMCRTFTQCLLLSTGLGEERRS